MLFGSLPILLTQFLFGWFSVIMQAYSRAVF